MFLLGALKSHAATDKVALINRDDVLSYAEMDALSDAFAAWLLTRFGDNHSPIIIYGHKETNILPCIYGALKSGHAYVPLDTTVPPDRARGICDEVKPCCVIDFYNIGFEHDEVISSEMLRDILTHNKGIVVPQNRWVSGNDTAYILFTSGSTGRPKGVPISVANIVNLHREFDGWLDVSGGVVLNQISYSFDVSVCSVWLGAARGLTLYTIDKGMLENYNELFANLEKSDVALWVSTPSFAEMCAPSAHFSCEFIKSVEKFIFCGEVLTHRLVNTLFKRFPKSKVINTYGPTEATVLVTAVEITPEMSSSELSIPIGAPLNEVTLRVVDEDENEVASGERGQLLIISESVGTGYFERPEQTAKAFFIDSKTGKRGYRTGDMCFESGGQYYYCGRADNQLKINGFRVEIEDVENNLVKVSNISRAAVLPVYEDEKVSFLTAFVLLEKPDGLTNLKRATQIKDALKEFLPSYMVPRRITALESFPLNTNGKIDKKALSQLIDVK